MNRKPTKRIFAVRKAGDRSRWDEIGVVFANKDGSENLVLNYLPLDPATTIQLRPFDERAKDAPADAEES